MSFKNIGVRELLIEGFEPEKVWCEVVDELQCSWLYIFPISIFRE